MKKIFSRVGRRVGDMIGLDRMNSKFRLFTVNYSFLIFYTMLEGVFVNTLLYRISPEITIVIIYRAITYISSAFMFHLAAYTGNKKNPVTVMKIGAGLFLCTYLVLFFGMDYMANFYVLTAIMSGAGGAFYWQSHSMLLTNYTTKETRDVGIAILGVIAGVITLISPVISGFVIKLMPGDLGYRVMFGIGILAVGSQILMQRKLAPIEQEKHKSEILLALRLLRERFSYKMVLSYEFIRGMRDGTFAFILNMLLFEIVTDESLIGINTFLTGIMSISGSWVYGKLVRPGNRAVYLLAATTVMTAFCSIMFFKLSPVTVMTFTVLNAFLQIFVYNAYNNTAYDALVQSESTRRSMGEMLALRENAIAIGRLLGLLFMFHFSASRLGYVITMCALTAVQYVASIFLKTAIKSINSGESDSMEV